MQPRHRAVPRDFNWKLRAQLVALIRQAMKAGQPGLSSWQLEGMVGAHHGRVSGALSVMHNTLGDLVVVPGLYTVVPETRRRAGIYAVADERPLAVTTRQMELAMETT